MPPNENAKTKGKPMRLLSVADALNLEVGEQLPGLKGKLVQLYDRHTGESDYGPWSLQNLTLADTAVPAKKIKVCVSGHDPITARPGDVIYFISGKTGKGALKGLKREEEEYEGAVRPLVRAAKDAEITLQPPPVDAAAASAAPPSPSPSPSPPPPPSAEPAKPGRLPACSAQASEPKPKPPPPAIPAESEEAALRAARVLLARHAALMAQCVSAAANVLAEYERVRGSRVLPDSLLQTIIGCLYIEMARAVDVRSLPYQRATAPPPLPPAEIKEEADHEDVPF
jgi:hypothetical protein